MIVLSRVPRRVRMLVAGSGAALATVSSLAGGSMAGTVLALGVMAAALAFRLELRIDGRSRRYQRLDGIWPALSNRRGALEEFRWVHVDVFQTTTHVDFRGIETISRTYTVQLIWNRDHPAPPWTLYKGQNYDEAAANANAFAAELGLSVVEGSTLRKLRPELGPSAYDPRLEVPTKDRMVSLVARLRQ